MIAHKLLDVAPAPVPCRVGEPERVIHTVRVWVQVLRVQVVRDNRVRADEPADRGIVEAGIVEVQAGLVQPLAGEPLVSVQGA